MFITEKKSRVIYLLYSKPSHSRPIPPIQFFKSILVLPSHLTL
jgi:hypothetical protein